MLVSSYLNFVSQNLSMGSMYLHGRGQTNTNNIGIEVSVKVLKFQPKYWSFSFSISASNEYSGLISFRMDWFDLLAVQGTLKSLFQHHSSLLVCCYLLLWLKRLKKIHPHCYAVWKGNDILFLDDFYIIVAVVSYYPNTTQVVVSQIVMCNPKLYQWTFHILLH